MARRKPAADDGRTQRQKFIDKAKELGADEDDGAFERALGVIARAPAGAAKKAAKAPKKRKS